MIHILSSQRFLAAYSGLLTILFLMVIISGFAKADPKQSFDEITVHRINIVEPDGTIRLVLTNTSNSPSIYIKNKEYPHPNGRKAAGLIFFDEEGTEDGGLACGIFRTLTPAIILASSSAAPTMALPSFDSKTWKAATASSFA